MYNVNFYDAELHRAITNQKDTVRITTRHDPEDDAGPNAQTSFAIGETVMSADTSPECLVHYLLQPLLEHHDRPVTIDGHSMERLRFQPKAATRYRLMPRLLEGNHRPHRDDFAGHRQAGIIIDGVKYLPNHAQWSYDVRAEESPHPHWSSLTGISVYPLIDLGNPPHSDPTHLENIAEAISQSLAPEYRVPDWMSRSRCPDPETVYDSWTPQDDQDKPPPHWALRSVPIAVNGTPALIEVPDRVLAFTLAHALYNSPDLALVPVKEAKPGDRHVTVTCPNPDDVVIINDQGERHRAGDGLPAPDGPVTAIEVPCQADGEDLTSQGKFLFHRTPSLRGQDAKIIYATGRHATIDHQ